MDKPRFEMERPFHSEDFAIRPAKRYNWKPQPDITAYELALCIPILAFHYFEVETAIGALPESAQRHFEEITR